MGELLRKMASGGVELALIDGKLKARGGLTDENCIFIQSHKADLIAELQKRESPRSTRPQFRITLKDGRTFLQSHSAGVTPEGLKTFNEKEWGLAASIEPVPWEEKPDEG